MAASALLSYFTAIATPGPFKFHLVPRAGCRLRRAGHRQLQVLAGVAPVGVGLLVLRRPVPSAMVQVPPVQALGLACSLAPSKALRLALRPVPGLSRSDWDPTQRAVSAPQRSPYHTYRLTCRSTPWHWGHS